MTLRPQWLPLFLALSLGLPLLFTLGCDTPVSEHTDPLTTSSEGTLESGGSVTGPEGFRISASKEALEEPIPVEIRIEEPTEEMSELNEPLEPASHFYTVRTDHTVMARTGSGFSASFPIPENAAKEDLVLAVWIPADSEFVISDEEQRSGHWSIVDGIIVDDRFESSFYALTDEPYYFVLGEGEWFHSGHESRDSGEEDVDERQQELGSSVDLEIKCSGGDDICRPSQQALFLEYFEETMFEFDSRVLGDDETFPEPYLRDHLTDTYKIYFVDTTSHDFRGRYTPGTGKLQIGIWPGDKEAPTILVEESPDGATFVIQIEDTTYTAEAECGCDLSDSSCDESSCVDPSEIAEELAESIRSTDSPHDVVVDKRAQAFGSRIMIPYNGESRDSTPDVSVDATEGGAIAIEEVEYETLHTGNHEYFHALQGGAFWEDSTPLPFPGVQLRPPYREGAAVASERARYRDDNGEIAPMQRNPIWPLLSIDQPLFPDDDLYQGQDFYVFVGRQLGLSQEWVIPMMSRDPQWYDPVGLVAGTLDQHKSTLSQLEWSLDEAYWDFVRNQFIERQEPLDESSTWDRECEPNMSALDDGPIQWDELGYDYGEGEQTKSFSVGQYTAKVIEIDFWAIDGDQTESFLIEAEGKPSTHFAIYQGEADYTENCEDDCEGSSVSCFDRPDISKKVVNISPDLQRATYYVLVAAIEDDTVDITIGPTNTEVTFQHEDGTLQVSGRTTELSAEYVAAATPAQLNWYHNDEALTETQTLYEGAGDISVTLDESCPDENDTNHAKVEVIDADGAVATDVVGLEMISDGTHLAFDISNSYACVGMHELPLDGGSFPFPGFITVEVLHGYCSDTVDDIDWAWNALLPNGDTKESTGPLLQLNEDEFEDGDSFGAITVTATSDEIDGEVSTIITPCGSDSSLPGCNEGTFCGSDYATIRKVMRLADLHSMWDEYSLVTELVQRLYYQFDGLVPEELPDNSGSIYDYLETRDVIERGIIDVLKLIEHALDSDSPEEFSRDWNKARELSTTVHDEAGRAFLNEIFALVQAHRYYYTPFGKGGGGGWYDLSFVDGWRAGTPDPNRVAHNAFLYALTTWVDAFERHDSFSLSSDPLPLDDPRITERARDVALTGTVRDLIEDISK